MIEFELRYGHRSNARFDYLLGTAGDDTYIAAATRGSREPDGGLTIFFVRSWGKSNLDRETLHQAIALGSTVRLGAMQVTLEGYQEGSTDEAGVARFVGGPVTD